MPASPIPIRNLYYLLCYAWNRLDEGQLVDVERVPSAELADLFAVVLLGGIQHVARRGLEQGYQEHEDELAGIRGRLRALESERRFLPIHGRAACAFDELTPNTLANRILKSTLRILWEVSTLDKTLRHRVIRMHREMVGITEVRLSAQTFRMVQLHGNNRFYKFLLNVCELVHGAWLVDQKSGEHRFRDFVRDERKMARVFQDFVFNFLRLERPDLSVRRERIPWKAVSSTDPGLAMLPRMETDISIRRGTNHTIVDTKYYRETLNRYYEAETFHSGHLYQIMSYLSNAEREPGEDLHGMLLYPVVDRQVRESYVLQGFPVRICTVDLGKEWMEVSRELLEMFA